MNSLLASSINGTFNNQQIANGSSTSVLSSSIDFSVTGVMTNASSHQGKSIIKLTGSEDILYNGQNKLKNVDQNKNSIDYVSMNGNKEKASEDTIPVPKVYLYTGKIHVEWNQVYKIGAGLNNLGNTCFMNTVIQCLTYCPPLANYLLCDNDHASKCDITGFCMMCLLQRHMKRALGKTGEVIKPLDVYQRLKLIAKHFQFGRQEDAHEFLRYVIDHLWKSCLSQTNGVSKLDSASKETTVINKIFGGYHRSQVTCLRCRKESNTFDHFMDFILDIKQNVVSLEKALEKFTQSELLQHENSYKCPKCKMKVDAQKRFSVYKAPTVATFQLKRFDYNRAFGGKITKPVSYPEMLNLRPYMSDTQGSPVWYRLNAVLVHSGASCNSGHYYCYVRNSNNLWYIMDDQRVHQVTKDQVLAQSAYVLFYIKTENTSVTKKCLDNKNGAVKGVIANSHTSKVPEVNGVKVKTMPLNEKNSSFSNAKACHSPNNFRKLDFSPKREKISFAFRPGPTSTTLASPQNRTLSSGSVSSKSSKLVPYVGDSSESSDTESTLSQTKPNSILDTSGKPLSKNGSIDSYKSSPHLEIKTKLSKSVFNTPSHSLAKCPQPKVSATSSWIVADNHHIPVLRSPSSASVNSTTDWDVIDVPDLKLTGSPKVSENNSSSRIESLVSSKMTSPVPSENSSEMSTNNSSASTIMFNGYENGSSSQNCNFRKQLVSSKTSSPKDEENSFKRKHSSSYTEVSKDSPYSEHSESRVSPLPKKAKYAENSSVISGTSIRNSGSNNVSSVARNEHYSTNYDKDRRTSLVNGSLSNESRPKTSPVKDYVKSNGYTELSSKRPEKDVFSKEKRDSSHSESSNSFMYKKEQHSSNQGNNRSLYGTDVPTWRGDNHYRPSQSTGHEIRRSFDDYDNEFDRGKVRKSKPKDRFHYFRQKNQFQNYANRFQGKYHGKFHHNHNNHHRKYPDSRRNWQYKHSSGYQNRNNQYY